MTCIVGLVEGNTVFIGGDTAGSSGCFISERADGKVFRLGEFLIGFSGSYRIGQLLRYKFQPPTLEVGVELHRYMVLQFVDALRECLKEGGAALKVNDVETGGHFLVGIRGRLFGIETDYQVADYADNFAACGCGRDFAMGSLFSTSIKNSKARVRLALESAERFDACVRGPFTIENTES
jgi:ATP-dependent protease HslVU (ClpYQ) peptidase subunit